MTSRLRARIRIAREISRLLLLCKTGEHVKKFAVRVRLGMSFPILFATVERATPTSFISKTRGVGNGLGSQITAKRVQ